MVSDSGKETLYVYFVSYEIHSRESFSLQAGKHIILLIGFFPVGSRPFTLERSSFLRKTAKGR